MKFSSLREQDLDMIRMEEVERKRVEYKHVGSVNKHAGHIMFSFNTLTKEIKPAIIEHSVAVGFNGRASYTHTVLKEKDCMYLQALNRKNLIKKLKKQGYL